MMVYLDYDPADDNDGYGYLGDGVSGRTGDTDETEPTCDICGEPEDHRIGWYEYDWNGETGNHLSCEKNPPPVEKECGS